MRYAKYEELSKRIPEIKAQRLQLYGEIGRRVVSRPKDPEEIEVLIRLDELRMRRWEKEGKLVYLGNRTYKLKV